MSASAKEIFTTEDTEEQIRITHLRFEISNFKSLHILRVPPCPAVVNLRSYKIATCYILGIRIGSVGLTDLEDTQQVAIVINANY